MIDPRSRWIVIVGLWLGSVTGLAVPCRAASFPEMKPSAESETPEPKEPPAEAPQAVLIQDRLDFAAGLYARNMYDMALSEYRNLIREHPKHADIYRAHFGVGECLFFLSQYAKASETYRDYQQRFPGSPLFEMARRREAESLYHLEKFEEAAARFETLKTSPETAARSAAFYYLGKIRYESEDPAGAREYFSEIREASEENKFWEFANYYLGEIALAENRSDEARVFFETILAVKNPVLVQLAYLGLGKARFQKSNYQAAHDAFYQAFQMQADAGVRSEAFLNDLKSLYNLDRYEEVIASYERYQDLLEEGEAGATAKQLVANAYTRTKDHESAGRLLASIEEDAGANPEQRERAMLGRAESLLFSGQADKALAKLETIPAEGAVFADRLLFLKGEAARRVEDWEKAVAAFDALTAGYPDSIFTPRALFSKGYLYIDAGDPLKARQTLLAFVGRYPSHEWAAKALADAVLVSVNAKAWKNAVEDSLLFLKTFSDRPDSRKIHYRLAGLYSESGDFANAYAVYEKHREQYRDQNLESDIEFLMGYNKQLAGDLEAAMTHYAEVDPAAISPYLYYATLKNKAYCAFQLERFHEAADTYQKIITEVPDHELKPEVYFWLADHYGRLQDAVAMRAVLESFKERPEAAEHPAELQYYLGESFRIEKRYAEALGAYEAVLAAGSVFQSNAWLGKGLVLAGQEKFAEAKEAFNEGLKLAKEDHALAVELRMQIANAQFALSEFGEAAKGYMAVAILFDDENTVPVALFNAGQAFTLASQAEEAETAFGELLERFPGHPLAAEVQEKRGQEAA